MADEPRTTEPSQTPPAENHSPPESDGVARVSPGMPCPQAESPDSQRLLAEVRPACQVPKAAVPLATPAPAAKTPAPAQESKDVFREITETIVFVVVLVLLLKTFVAEAFVIPTGSMATTLWGYQKFVECPQCRYHFPVNCSSEMDPQSDRHMPVRSCICPNCRQRIEFRDRPSPGEPKINPVAGEMENPPGNSGDRVLVLKALYDLKPLFARESPAAQRHDVVVFKYPEGPQKNHVAMNYIKRLIGLPGETIGIYYGKIYVATQLPYPDLPDLPSPNEPGISEDERSQRKAALRRATRENDTEAVKWLRRDARLPLNDPGRKFAIVRKQPGTILAMMRPVYDNDFQPANKSRFPIRWSETASWKADSALAPRTFRHAQGSSGVAWLRYQHLLPDQTKPELITDFTGYNTSTGLNEGKQNWATDLILEFDAQVDKVDSGGELRVEISKGIDRFQARFDLATGDCTLVRLVAGAEQVLTLPDSPDPARRPTAVKGPGSYHIRLGNVDERLTLWVNDDLPFGAGVAYDPAPEAGPTENDLEPASIGARAASVTVSHLKLWRDTYYSVQGEHGDGARLNDEILANPSLWVPLKSLDAKTLYVQPAHYLCLGDNSQESADSRYWGLVPEELMLGRALVVYFPFYFPFSGPIHSPTNRVGMIR